MRKLHLSNACKHKLYLAGIDPATACNTRVSILTDSGDGNDCQKISLAACLQAIVPMGNLAEYLLDPGYGFAFGAAAIHRGGHGSESDIGVVTGAGRGTGTWLS